jgi:hypothetical protein
MLGGINANTAIDLVNEVLGLDLPKYDEAWANIPFPIIQSLANANNLQVADGIMRADVPPDPAGGVQPATQP